MVVNMGITAVSLIVTVVVLSIFYHDPSKPLPTWFRALTFNCLAPVACFTGDNKIGGTTEVKPIVGNALQQKTDAKEQVTYESASSLPYALMEYFSRMTEKEIDEQNCNDNKADWEKAARVIDRFCFFMTLFAISVLILYLSIGINAGE